MIFQLSQFQTQRFQKDGSALTLSLGEKLFLLGGGHVTDFSWEEPRNKDRLLQDVKDVEEQIRKFKYCGPSILTHPLVSRYRANAEANEIVIRIVASLAYLNLFRGITPDVMGLARTIKPDINDIGEILETRRIIATLIFQNVIAMPPLETADPFLPVCR